MIKLDIWNYFILIKNIEMSDRIRHLIMLKSDIWDTTCYVYTKICSNDDLHLEKTITMLNVIMLIKSAFNGYYNQNYY